LEIQKLRNYFLVLLFLHQFGPDNDSPFKIRESKVRKDKANEPISELETVNAWSG
jgi:hypothetical protein